MAEKHPLTDTTAQALFLSLECKDLLSKSLRHKVESTQDKRQDETHLTLSQLTALVENRSGAQISKWWAILNNSPKLQEDFKALLLHSGGVMQPQLAAAASDDVTFRSGDQFDLRLHISSKNDGSAYLVITFHTDTNTQYKHLFAKDAHGYHMIDLPPANNNNIQLLLDPNHPVKQAFADVAAEFFIK